MEGICVNVVNPVQFFRFLKGRCHGNQFYGKITYPLHLWVWHSKTECHGIYLNVRINSVNDASISCVNFVKFGPRNSRVDRARSSGTAAKKLAYFVKYLRIYWTDFRNLYTI